MFYIILCKSKKPDEAKEYLQKFFGNNFHHVERNWIYKYKEWLLPYLKKIQYPIYIYADSFYSRTFIELWARTIRYQPIYVYSLSYNNDELIIHYVKFKKPWSWLDD